MPGTIHVPQIWNTLNNQLATTATRPHNFMRFNVSAASQ
jgi:hypothetical protein